MAETSQDGWAGYAVGTPSKKKNWVNPDCQQFSTVAHVTHVNSALELMRVGGIRPQLIYDESRLNTQRILVVWLSPNDWGGAGGFRYGNVAFDLDLDALVAGKNCYWVGVMDYKPRACRILITDTDRSGELLPYDPGAGNGPWWKSEKAGRHYWNGHYCLELMLEGEVPLSAVRELRFVDHHAKRCSIDHTTCRDKGHDRATGAARLLAGGCDRRLLGRCAGLWVGEDGSPKPSLEFAWERLHAKLCAGIGAWDGAVTATHDRAAAVARAGLGTLCDQSKEDRKALFGLFDSEGSAVEAVAAVIEHDLDLKHGALARTFN